MYHRKRSSDSPVTIGELIKSSANHGLQVWSDEFPGARTLCVFDRVKGDVVSPEEFKRRQRVRAKERRDLYPQGRRRCRDRASRHYSHSLAP